MNRGAGSAMNPASDRPEIMTLPELAEYLRVPVTTLRDWRVDGRGPQAYKLVGQLRYRRSEVEAWIDAQAIEYPGGDPLRPRRRPARRRS